MCKKQANLVRESESEIFRLRARLSGQMEQEVATALAQGNVSALDVQPSLPKEGRVLAQNENSNAVRLELSDKIKSLQQGLQEAHGKLETAKRRIGTRDAEIARLGALLSSGKSHENPHAGGADRANQDAMEHLYNQIEFLNSQIGRYEKRVQEMQSENRRLTQEKRNAERSDKELSRALQRTQKFEEEMVRLRKGFNIDLAEIMSEYASDDSLDNAKLILEAYRTEKEKNQEVLETAKKASESAHDKQKALQAQVTKVVHQLARAQADAARFQDENDRLKTTVEQLTGELERIETTAAGSVLDGQKLAARAEVLRASSTRDKAEITALREKVCVSERALMNANEKN